MSDELEVITAVRGTIRGKPFNMLAPFVCGTCEGQYLIPSLTRQSIPLPDYCPFCGGKIASIDEKLPNGELRKIIEYPE